MKSRGIKRVREMRRWMASEEYRDVFVISGFP